MKKIGIIGGMGPEATILFYKEIINIFQNKYNAKFDSDFPEIYICNLPIPDIVNEPSTINITKKMICDASVKLEKIGMDFIAIPCNTINIIYDTYKNSVSIPILNIIEETGKKIKSRGYKKIALLASKTTYNSRLYEKYLNKYGLEVLIPDISEKEIINKIIFKILNGEKLRKDKEKIIEITNKLIKNGADCVVLGCTDLPILVKEKDLDITTFDTIKILAESTVKLTIENTEENLNKQSSSIKSKGENKK
jgi:aspartate racemase